MYHVFSLGLTTIHVLWKTIAKSVSYCSSSSD